MSRTLEVPDTKDSNHPFFNYTSGGWLYNDRICRQERHLVFGVSALLDLASKAARRCPSSVTGIYKIAEGGYNRIFEITFSDNHSVIARLPYPCTIPREFGIASEVATMQYLQKQGLPIPEVLDWSVSSNAAGSEYMILAKAEGSELESVWYTMSIEERSSIMKQIVELENKLFQLKLPASGSIYHRTFLETRKSRMIPLSDGIDRDDFCVGPSSELLWWYKGRDQIQVNHGPWETATEVMESVGQRELSWLQCYGHPRYPREVMYREFYDKKKVDPTVQMQSLRDYLTIARMIIPKDRDLINPTLCHPDLLPSNIFISESGQITALLDWQYTCSLPLFLQAKIPKHLQNYGDPDSEEFRPPKLAEEFETLSEEAKEEELELYRRRQVHFFYVGATSRYNRIHFDAMTQHHIIARSKLYDVATRPWEGDNTSLKAQIIRTASYWDAIASSGAENAEFPIQYSAEEIAGCLAIDQKQQEADEGMQTLRDHFPVNIDGWAPLHLFGDAKERESQMRAEMAKIPETEEEMKEFEEQWPFQNHEEID